MLIKTKIFKSKHAKYKLKQGMRLFVLPNGDLQARFRIKKGMIYVGRYVAENMACLSDRMIRVNE